MMDVPLPVPLRISPMQLDIDIYCSCRLPDNEGERMVLCDSALSGFARRARKLGHVSSLTEKEDVWHGKACKRLDVVLEK